MTYALDISPGRRSIDSDMLEWNARYPMVGISPEQAYANNTIIHAWRGGMRPLLPEEMPRALIAAKPRKSWPDTFKAVNGLPTVRGVFKDIIEEFDPGLHQFWPLSIHTKRGVEVDGPWFGMNVYRTQDTVVLDASKTFGDRNKLPHQKLRLPHDSNPKVTVDPSRGTGLNLWREGCIDGNLFCSDMVMARIKTAKLKTFSSLRAENLSDRSKELHDGY